MATLLYYNNCRKTERYKIIALACQPRCIKIKAAKPKDIKLLPQHVNPVVLK